MSKKKTAIIIDEADGLLDRYVYRIEYVNGNQGRRFRFLFRELMPFRKLVALSGTVPTTITTLFNNGGSTILECRLPTHTESTKHRYQRMVCYDKPSERRAVILKWCLELKKAGKPAVIITDDHWHGKLYKWLEKDGRIEIHGYLDSETIADDIVALIDSLKWKKTGVVVASDKFYRGLDTCF